MVENLNTLTLLPCTMHESKFAINLKWTIKESAKVMFCKWLNSSTLDFKRRYIEKNVPREEIRKRWASYKDQNYFYSPEHHISHPVTNERVKIQLRLIRKHGPNPNNQNTEKYRVEHWQNGRWKSLPSHVHSIDLPDFDYVACLWNDVYYTPDKQNTLDEDLRVYLASIHGETIAFGGETHSIKECSKETLLAFISEEHTEDFVIECDGQEFKVKKIILQSRSPVFDAMLSSNNYKEAKENRMIIIDFDAEIVQKMIEYFETDFVKDTSNCEVELYKLARKYQSQSIMNFTLRLMIHTLTDKNAPDRLEIAEVHDDEEAARMINLWKDSGAYLKDGLNFESLFARLGFN